jgi:hypothetical protein
MRLSSPLFAAALSLASVVSTLAQGSLTPPGGAPIPTYRTLQQVEPRVPIATLPFTITQSGSYYFTGNLDYNGAVPAITIQTSHVTLDLMGFTLRSDPAVNQPAIFVTGTNTSDVVVRNGRIVGQTVVTITGGAPSGSWSVTYGGFSRGVQTTSATSNVRVEHLTIAGCRAEGINLGGQSHVISDCRAHSNGADGFSVALDGQIERSISERNFGSGFFGSSAVFRDCQAIRNGGHGFNANSCVFEGCAARMNQEMGFSANASTAENCLSQSNGAAGFFGDRGIWRGCIATFNSGPGIDSYDSTIVGCTSRNNTGRGINSQRSTISQCVTGANGSTGIHAEFSVVSFCRATDGAVTTSSVLTGNSL